MYLFDVRFLSSAEDIHVKHTDFKVFKYENKKSESELSLAAGKQSYCERRGQAWAASAKRPARLRDALRELEERLREERVLVSCWPTPSLLRLVFSSGLVVYVTLHPHTAHITRIFFDRYCIGKIPANATGAIFTDTHLLFTFAENFTILITFNPPTSPTRLEKINQRDPKYQTIELYGPTRKCEKRVCVRAGEGECESRVLVWSESAAGELFPWSPAVRGEDRANVHIYTLHKSQMTLLCYHRVENEALSVELSQAHHNIIYTVQQKTYQKGGLSVHCSSYEVEAGALQPRACSVVRVPAPARAVRRSPCEARLLLACIDATLLVHHEAHGVTTSVKAAFIPSVVRWAEGLVVACEERGRLQCFDLSLAPLPASAAHEDAKFIDIGAYLKRQCLLADVAWSGQRGACPQFLLSFEGGPLALLRLTLSDVITRWLSSGQVSRATTLLRALSWDTEGDTCLHILHTVVQHVFRKPLSACSELLLQEALGSFHQPASPLSASAVSEYGAPVHDLTRKFFHHLLRYRRLEKALSLAVDLAESDLFMDVAYAATRLGDQQLAHEAQQHALHTINQHSTCSMSSCSQCSSECGSSRDAPHAAALASPRSPPPLPYLPEPQPALVLGIRPAHLDREPSLWHRPDRRYELERRPTHEVVDVIPRPDDEAGSVHFGKIYQAELREETGGNSWQKLQAENRSYRCVYGQRSAMASRYPPSEMGSPVPLGLEKHAPGTRSAAAEHRTPSAKFSAGGEKNKVKFSDTVTVAVVPEIVRKEKLAGNVSLESARVTDPRKELADSLPLCHPNHDYLRDFAPAAPENDANETQAKIKVVHFGLV